MDLGIQGKTGIVTGGSRGIRRDTARRPLEAGGRVAICARTKDQLEETRDELVAQTRGEVLAVAADTSVEGDLKGKTAAAAKGAGDTFTMEAFILPAHGLAAKDVRVINANTTDRLPVLRARNVDVIMLAEPTATVAEKEGYARNLVPDFCTYDVSAMMSIVHPKTVETQRTQAVGYLRAWLKAAGVFKTHFDDYVETSHAHEISQGAKGDIATTREALKKLIIAPELNDVMLKRLEVVAKALKAEGQIPRLPDFAGKKEMLDLGLLQEAKNPL